MPEPETGAGGGVKTGTITPDTPARPGFVGRHRAYGYGMLLLRPLAAGCRSVGCCTLPARLG